MSDLVPPKLIIVLQAFLLYTKVEDTVTESVPDVSRYGSVCA
jgi:hypothetical protein